MITYTKYKPSPIKGVYSFSLEMKSKFRNHLINPIEDPSIKKSITYHINDCTVVSVDLGTINDFVFIYNEDSINGNLEKRTETANLISKLTCRELVEVQDKNKKENIENPAKYISISKKNTDYKVKY